MYHSQQPNNEGPKIDGFQLRQSHALCLQRLGFVFDPAMFVVPPALMKLKPPSSHDSDEKRQLYVAAAQEAGFRGTSHRESLQYIWGKILRHDITGPKSLYAAIENRVESSGNGQPFLNAAIRAGFVSRFDLQKYEKMDVWNGNQPAFLQHPMLGGMHVMSAIENLAAGSFNSITRPQLIALKWQLDPSLPVAQKPLTRYLLALRPGPVWDTQDPFSVCQQQQAADARMLEAEAVKKITHMLERVEVRKLLAEYAACDMETLDKRHRFNHLRLAEIAAKQPMTKERAQMLGTCKQPRNRLGSGQTAPQKETPVPAVQPCVEAPKIDTPPQTVEADDGAKNRHWQAQFKRQEEKNKRKREHRRWDKSATNLHAQDGPLGRDAKPEQTYAAIIRPARDEWMADHPEEGPLCKDFGI